MDRYGQHYGLPVRLTEVIQEAGEDSPVDQEVRVAAVLVVLAAAALAAVALEEVGNAKINCFNCCFLNN